MTVDERFFRPRTPVSVAAVGDLGEAYLVRSILENIGASVLLHLIGTPEDFLQVIGQGDDAPRHLVICGHGDETGLVFGDFGDGIDTMALHRGAMPPEAMAARADLPGTIVVSTACATGTQAFGDAFLKGRAGAYIAPDGYPEGTDAALFVHLLFERLLKKGQAPGPALRHMQAYDAAFAAFRLFGGR